jgi:hypothetical protein
MPPRVSSSLYHPQFLPRPSIRRTEEHRKDTLPRAQALMRTCCDLHPVAMPSWRLPVTSCQHLGSGEISLTLRRLGAFEISTLRLDRDLHRGGLARIYVADTTMAMMVKQ